MWKGHPPKPSRELEAGGPRSINPDPNDCAIEDETEAEGVVDGRDIVVSDDFFKDLRQQRAKHIARHGVPSL